ncbi:hypothetical protein SPARM206S_03458 [Streptomyces parvulus]
MSFEVSLEKESRLFKSEYLEPCEVFLCRGF